MFGFATERTPLLHAAVNISPQPEERQGFEIGNHDQNVKYGQQILDDATADRQLYHRLKPVLKDAAIEFVATAATICSTYATTFTLMGKEASNADIILLNSYTLATSNMIAPLKKIGEAILHAPKGEKLAAATMKTAITRTDNEVQPLLQDLPQDTREGIQSTIDELKTAVKNIEEDAAFNRPPQFLLKSYQRVIKQLSFPYHTPNTYQHDLQGDPEKGRRIDLAQQKLVSSYPQQIQESLNDVMNAHRLSSLGDTSIQPFHIFEGPPAVGKTFAVREMAKVLGAKLIEGSENDFADFLGVPRRDGGKLKETWDPDLWEYHQREGKIWKNIKETATDGNFILFVDELSFAKNPNLLSAFKSWMTGNPRLIPNSKDLAIDKKFSIIAASNEELYDQLGDDAAKSRVTTHIKFPHWTDEEFATRVQEHVQRLAVKRQLSKRPLTSFKTHKDLNSLVPHILAAVKRYPVGSFSLRDIQLHLDRLSNRFQIANDTAEPHSLAVPYNIEEYPKKIEEHFASLIQRRHPDLKPIAESHVLGGRKPEGDQPFNVYFLEKYLERAATAAATQAALIAASEASTSTATDLSKLHPQLQKTITQLAGMNDGEIYSTFDPDCKLVSKEQRGYLVKQTADFFYFQRPEYGKEISLFAVHNVLNPLDVAPPLGTSIRQLQAELEHPQSTVDLKGKNIVA